MRLMGNLLGGLPNARHCQARSSLAGELRRALFDVALHPLAEVLRAHQRPELQVYAVDVLRVRLVHPLVRQSERT